MGKRSEVKEADEELGPGWLDVRTIVGGETKDRGLRRTTTTERPLRPKDVRVYNKIASKNSPTLLPPSASLAATGVGVVWFLAYVSDFLEC